MVKEARDNDDKKRLRDLNSRRAAKEKTSGGSTSGGGVRVEGPAEKGSPSKKSGRLLTPQQQKEFDIEAAYEDLHAHC